jgi:hypothetical protein
MIKACKKSEAKWLRFFELIGKYKIFTKIYTFLCRISATTPLSSPLGARQSASFLYQTVTGSVVTFSSLSATTAAICLTFGSSRIKSAILSSNCS